MRSLFTLTFISSILFINNVNAMDSVISACNQAVEKGDATTALSLSSKVLSKSKNDKDALICQGRALSAQGDLSGAVASLKAATENSTDVFDKTIASILMGNAYKVAKQYDQAIASYQQSLAFAQADKNQKFERISQNLIGDAYSSNAKFEQALAAYVSANKLSANDNERGESFENIALMHHNLNQHDLALEYQVKAYLTHEKVGTLDQYAHSSIELGRYYTLTKNYLSAESTLNKIIKFAKEQGGAYYEAQGSYLLAKVKVATGDVESAKALVQNAKLIAKNTNDKALEQEINQETQSIF